MRNGLTTTIESLDLGVERYGGARHIVNLDAAVTAFFCGARGVRVGRRHWWLKPTCRGCIAEARRLQIEGV